MKQIIIAGLVLFCVVGSACKKSKGGDSCSTEPALNVTMNPANNSTEPASPGPSFPLTVSITNLSSSGGVITVNARPENSNTNFFSESRNTTTATNNFTITGTPASTAAIVQVTVTSQSCNTNRFTGSYRYSRK